MPLTDEKLNANISNWNASFGKKLADALNADVSDDATKLKMGAMGDAIVDLVLRAKMSEAGDPAHTHEVE